MDLVERNALFLGRLLANHPDHFAYPRNDPRADMDGPPLVIHKVIYREIEKQIQSREVSAPEGQIQIVTPSVRVIVEEVANFYQRSFLDIMSRRRTGNLIWPRHVAFYLARMMTGKSLPEIGRIVGGRDHSTVLNSVGVVSGLMLKDERVADEIELLKLKINERVNQRAAA